MGGMPQYVDISEFQSTAIDWQAYKTWSKQGDGISRLCIRSSYGTGFVDNHYKIYRLEAEAAGIDQIIHYHYAYPSLNLPTAEADYQKSVTGVIGPNDLIMLDFEEGVAQANAEWAFVWLMRQEFNYNKTPIIYANSSMVQNRLQKPGLARFPLVLANWTYDPNNRPASPAPWKFYSYFQFTDRGSVPGIPGLVDVNVYLGGTSPVSTLGSENAVFIDGVDQFTSGGEDTCVADTGSLIWHATKPGTNNSYTPGQVQDMANWWYIHFDGSIVSQAGLSEGQLHEMLTALGLSWELYTITSNGTANDTWVRDRLREGKIIACCAWEASFFDIALGKVPYLWDSTPFNHCITLTGLDAVGVNVFARDTAETGYNFPPSSKRIYDLGKMQYVSLTAVVPSWLTGANMGTPIDLTMPLVAARYQDDGKGGWQVRARSDYRDGTPIHVHGLILDHYTKIGSNELGLNGLTEYGVALTNEYPTAGRPTTGKGSTAVDQEYERAILRYDPDHMMDAPPGAGKVYTVHMEWLVQLRLKLMDQLKAVSLNLDQQLANVAALQAELAAAIAGGGKLPQAVLTDITNVEAAVTQLMKDLSTV